MGRNFIPIEVVFNQISCFKKRIFHFDRFPNATRYNPPINFRMILLATLRHVVQNHWTVITQ